MKEGYKFVFVTNCSPMGDCKNFDAQFYNAIRDKGVFNVRNDASEPKTDFLKKPVKNKPGPKFEFNPSKCGMVNMYFQIST